MQSDLMHLNKILNNSIERAFATVLIFFGLVESHAVQNGDIVWLVHWLICIKQN